MTKHTHDLEGFSMVTRNKTDDVHVRYEDRAYVPAVCVKVRGRLMDRAPVDVANAPNNIRAAAHDYVQERWWQETPQALADKILGKAFKCGADAQSAGRSRGWVIVRGIGTPGDWNAKKIAAWKRFEKAIESSMKDAETMWQDEVRERLRESGSKRRCFETHISAWPITLDQYGPDDFTVTYGKQVDEHLTYVQAATKLGLAIMHALACERQLDNRALGDDS